MGRLKRVRLAATAMGAVLALAVSGPEARGEDPAPPSQVEITLGYGFLAPRNLDLDYAFVDATGNLSGGGTVHTLVLPRRGTPAFGLKWRFARPEGLQFVASAWQQDFAAESGTGVRPRNVGALLASPDFAIGRSLVDEARARTQVRLTQVDAGLAWSSRLGSSASLQIAGGVRVFRYEEERLVTYRRDEAGVLLEEVLSATFDADGLGPKAEVSFRAHLRTWLVFQAGMGLAVAVGEISSLATDSAFVGGSFDRATVVDRPSTRRAFVQWDGRVGLEFFPARTLDIGLGYRFVSWGAVRPALRFADDVSQNTAFPQTSDVVAEGPFVAARVRF